MKLVSIRLIIGYVALTAFNISGADLKIKIEDCISNKGKLYISLIKNKESFKKILTTNQIIFKHVDDIFAGTTKKLDKSTIQTVTLSGIPYGKYSIMIFQDLNNNQKLDQWIFGPTEPYGFSKNPTIKFSPPQFENTLIKIKNQKSTVNIKLN